VCRLANRESQLPPPSAAIGDRLAILAHISLLNSAEKPVVPEARGGARIPGHPFVAGLLVALVRQVAGALRSSEIYAQSNQPPCERVIRRPILAEKGD